MELICALDITEMFEVLWFMSHLVFTIALLVICAHYIRNYIRIVYLPLLLTLPKQVSQLSSKIFHDQTVSKTFCLIYRVDHRVVRQVDLYYPLVKSFKAILIHSTVFLLMGIQTPAESLHVQTVTHSLQTYFLSAPEEIPLT